MNYTIKEKGKNYKGLWVVEVIRNKDGFTVETREFTTKKALQTWLKTQTEWN